MIKVSNSGAQPPALYRGLFCCHSINPIPQNPRTLESDHPPRSQHNIFTGLRISSFSFLLVLDTEFPESADQDILPVCQGLLDDLQEGFEGLMGLGMAKVFVDGVYDVGLDKGHGGGPFRFLWGLALRA